MELTCKRATMKDIDALVEERIRAWKAEDLNGKTEDPEQEAIMREHAYSYYRRNLTDHEDVVYLLYDGTKLVGIGNVYFIHRRPVLRNQDKERAYISQLDVRPEYRTDLVEMKLLDLLVGAAMENNSQEVVVDDAADRREALARFGFHQEKEEQGAWIYAL